MNEDPTLLDFFTAFADVPACAQRHMQQHVALPVWVCAATTPQLVWLALLAEAHGAASPNVTNARRQAWQAYVAQDDEPDAPFVDLAERITYEHAAATAQRVLLGVLLEHAWWRSIYARWLHWAGEPLPLVEYRSALPGHLVLRSCLGTAVGRLAVRQARTPHEIGRHHGPWCFVVDHTPTGQNLGAFESRAVAFELADRIDRALPEHEPRVPGMSAVAAALRRRPGLWRALQRYGRPSPGLTRDNFRSPARPPAGFVRARVAAICTSLGAPHG